LIVSRDGFCILARAPKLSNPETFSAMSATTFGAAEAAVSVLGPEPVRTMVAETRDGRMTIAGIDDDYLMVVMTDRRAGSDADVHAVQEIAAAAAKLLKG
ncbi:MAG: roadblock/LC7 domain-containing protein, partial [Myxococcota bacterium]